MIKILAILFLLLPTLAGANDIATLMGKDPATLSTWAGKDISAISTIMGGGVAAEGGEPPTISLVQHDTVYDDGPVVLNGVTAGSLVVVSISGNTTTQTTTLAGFVKAGYIFQSGSDEPSIALFYVLNHAGGNISAAVTNPPSDIGWTVAEFSTTGTAFKIDGSVVTAAEPDTGTTLNTGNFPANYDYEVLIAVSAAASAPCSTLTTSDSFLTDADFKALDHIHIMSYRIISSSGTYSTTFTYSNNQAEIVAIIGGFYSE